MQIKRIISLIITLTLLLALSSCISKDSFDDEDPEFNYQLSLEYLRLGKISEGVEELKKVLKKDPDNLNAMQMLASVYAKSGKDKEALNLFETITKKYPKNPTAFIYIGVIETQNRNFTKAQTYFKNALKINPDDPYTNMNYALSLSEEGKFNEAIKHYKEAIKIKPDLLLAVNNLGQTYKNKGDYDLALEMFKSVIDKDPKNIMTLSNIGKLYYAMNDFEKSLEYHEKVIDIDPKRFYNYTLMGEIYTETGNFEKAEASFRAAISENPDFAVAYDGLAFLYAESGNKLDYAKEMIEKAINKGEENKHIYTDTLAWIYFKKGDLSAALKTAKESEKLFKENGFNLSNRAKYHLGMINLKLNKTEEADKYLKDLIKKEEEVLKARVAAYGQRIIELDWAETYKYQSPEFKTKVTSVEYGRRHPVGLNSGTFVSTRIVKYLPGKVAIADDLMTAKVEILRDNEIIATAAPIPVVRPVKPVTEGWEKADGIWYRTAIPDEVTIKIHVSGAITGKK